MLPEACGHVLWPSGNVTVYALDKLIEFPAQYDLVVKFCFHRKHSGVTEVSCKLAVLDLDTVSPLEKLPPFPNRSGNFKHAFLKLNMFTFIWPL